MSHQSQEKWSVPQQPKDAGDQLSINNLPLAHMPQSTQSIDNQSTVETDRIDTLLPMCIDNDPQLQQDVNLRSTSGACGSVSSFTQASDQAKYDKLTPGEMLSLLGEKPNSYKKPNTIMTTCVQQDYDADLIKAQETIGPIVDGNPNALGIVLLASHQDVHHTIAYDPDLSDEQNKKENRLQPLKVIEKGAQKLEEAFTMCGLAVVRVENPSKSFLIALMKVLSSMRTSEAVIKCPELYRYFFFYTTGHGANRVFFTKDGSISYQDVYNTFQGFLSQRYFFFDCCRSYRLDSISLYPNRDRVIPTCPEFTIDPHNRIIYATASGMKSWGPIREGSDESISYMTEMIKCLLKKRLSMDQLLSQLHEKLPKLVKKETGEKQYILNVDCTPTRINLWEEQKKRMTPWLDPLPGLSEDGAVIQLTPHSPPPVTSNAFHQHKSYQFQMKSGTSWITMDEFGGTLHPNSAPITITTPRQSDSVACKSASYSSHGKTNESSNHQAQAETIRRHRSSTTLRPFQESSYALKIPVDQLHKKMAEFRVVTTLQGNLEIPSASVLMILNPVKPKVVCSSKIHFREGGSPHATISWDIPSSPLTIGFQGFNVNIQNGNNEVIHSERVDFNPRKFHYEESFDIPEINENQEGIIYSVKVEALRSDGLSVFSEPINLETSKDHNCLSRRRKQHICVISSWLCVFSILFVLIALLVSNHLTLRNYKYHKYIPRINVSSRTVFEIQNTIPADFPSSFSTLLIQPDFTRQALAITEASASLPTYCNEISSVKLDSSQTLKQLGPMTTGIDQIDVTLTNRVDFLPIGEHRPEMEYLLPNSLITICLSLLQPINNGLVYLELHQSEDWLKGLNSSIPLQKIPISFSVSQCSNTTLNISLPNELFVALSTSSTIYPVFSTIEGYIHQIYYSVESLELIKDSNKLKSKPITISKQSNSKLVCYIDAEIKDHSDILDNDILIVISVPFHWKLWALGITAVILIILILIGLVFTCCVYGWFCYLKEKCKKSEQIRYELLSNSV